MAKAIDAAIYLSNKVIELSEKEKKKGYVVDFIKVHKMLYIAQGIMLAKFNKTLFDETIYAHHEGPWIDNLTIFYGMVEFKEIKKPLKMISVLELTEKRKMVLDYVAEKYGYQTRDALVLATKAQKPYSEAFSKNIDIFGVYPIISLSSLKSFFEQKELNEFNSFYKIREKLKNDSKDIVITTEEYEKTKEFIITLNPEYENLLNQSAVEEKKQFTIKIKK